MLTKNSRRALSSRIDNEGSPAKRRRVDQASKTNIVKIEVSESTENKRKGKASQNSENCNPGPSTSRARILPTHSSQALSEMINDKGSQEKKLKVDRASKKTVVKTEISEPLDKKLNIKTSPSTNRVKNSAESNVDIVNSKMVQKENNDRFQATLHTIIRASEKVEVNEINREYTLNVENCIQGPSTSKAKFTKLNTDVKKEILPIRADTDEDNLNISNEALLNLEEAIADNDEDIVELDVPQQVLEEVLLSSDDEDEQIETRNRVTTPMDNSVKLSSKSGGSSSQIRTSASCNNNIDIIKIEDPSPQSTITPKKKKLVLDHSILTPPTGDFQENAAKYWKCLQFLEQSDLNPEAQEFVPSPKISKKTADIQPSDCIVCLEPRETTFLNLPCRHAVTCGPCSDQLELLGKNCPVCRTPIQTRFQIYN